MGDVTDVAQYCLMHCRRGGCETKFAIPEEFRMIHASTMLYSLAEEVSRLHGLLYTLQSSINTNSSLDLQLQRACHADQSIPEGLLILTLMVSLHSIVFKILHNMCICGRSR